MPILPLGGDPRSGLGGVVVMAKRGKVGKAPERPDEKPVKLNLSLPADLARRFGVHAEMSGQSKSDLFAELVRAGCRRWVVSDRQGGAGEPTDGIEPGV